MTTPAEDAWVELVEAELATADGPAIHTFRRLIGAYEQIGLPDVALSLLRKACDLETDARVALPALLRACRNQRQFAELNALVQKGLAFPERHADLRQELALALSSLGQTSAAAAEWQSLIRTGCMTEADWLECARFVMNAADPPSLERIMTAIAERQEPISAARPLIAFCSLKHLIDQDRAAARNLLEKVNPAGIADGNILLDFAILAWRLQDYMRAETAATLAASSADTPSGCRTVLATIRAFVGDTSLLKKASLPAAGPAGQCVSKLAHDVKRDAAAWGFLHRRDSDSFDAKLLALMAEPDMTVPRQYEPLATFSILPEHPQLDPFHILCGLDWSCPHVMLQRKPDGAALHFFLEARGQGRRDWLWEEVSPRACDLGNDHTCSPGRQPSSTWAEALREITDSLDD